jgi:hypothetical protein
MILTMSALLPASASHGSAMKHDAMAQVVAGGGSHNIAVQSSDHHQHHRTADQDRDASGAPSADSEHESCFAFCACSVVVEAYVADMPMFYGHSYVDPIDMALLPGGLAAPHRPPRLS